MEAGIWLLISVSFFPFEIIFRVLNDEEKEEDGVVLWILEASFSLLCIFLLLLLVLLSRVEEWLGKSVR